MKSFAFALLTASVLGQEEPVAMPEVTIFDFADAMPVVTSLNVEDVESWEEDMNTKQME